MDSAWPDKAPLYDVLVSGRRRLAAMLCAPICARTPLSFRGIPSQNKALNNSNAKNREEGNSSIQDIAADRADRILILCGFEQCKKKKQIGMKDPSSRPSR
jgi:hypothetical protein